MLKPLSTLALVLISLVCLSQPAILKLKDGKDYSVVIKATSNTSIIVENTAVRYDQVISATFEEKEQRYESTYSRLAANGIEVRFADPAQTIAPTSVPVPEPVTTPNQLPLTPLNQAEYSETISLKQVVDGISKYKDQSAGGKTAMFIGAGILGASMILTSVYAKQNKDATSPSDLKEVPQALPIAGTVILTIGIAIDLDALRHLKFRR